MYFLGIIAGFVVAVATIDISTAFFLYSLLIFWGYIAGSITWRFIGQWCVKKDGGLKLWQYKWFPIKCFKGDAKKIRIDSYVMENRPKSYWDNTIYSIHQAKVSSYLMFGILFLITPKLSGSATLTDFTSFAYMLVFLSPILGAIIVPLYIFSDSSVVEVVPGERDFAPIGMTARLFLNSFVKWGLVGLISIKLLPVFFTSGFSTEIFQLMFTMVFIMSLVAASVLAASFSYSNDRHLGLVEEFNNIWFDLSVDQDHTFKQIDDNAFIVMPKHLLKETLTHLGETMGPNFAHVPKSHQYSELSPAPIQNAPPPPGFVTAPPPSSTVYSVESLPPPN